MSIHSLYRSPKCQSLCIFKQYTLASHGNDDAMHTLHYYCNFTHLLNCLLLFYRDAAVPFKSVRPEVRGTTDFDGGA